ncbi:hypothetical protein EPN29_02925 [bacterium]|nr:MAG: hypothetical protein EPN29_02925 [bacterium]
MAESEPKPKLVELVSAGAGHGWKAVLKNGRPAVVHEIPVPPAEAAAAVPRIQRLAEHRHPALSPVLAWGTDPKGIWVAVEPDEGTPLATILSRGPFTPAAAAALGTAVLSGVGALHEAGIAMGGFGASAVRITGNGDVRLAGHPAAAVRGAPSQSDLRADVRSCGMAVCAAFGVDPAGAPAPPNVPPGLVVTMRSMASGAMGPAADRAQDALREMAAALLAPDRMVAAQSELALRAGGRETPGITPFLPQTEAPAPAPLPPPPAPAPHVPPAPREETPVRAPASYDAPPRSLQSYPPTPAPVAPPTPPTPPAPAPERPPSPPGPPTWSDAPAGTPSPFAAPGTPKWSDAPARTPPPFAAPPTPAPTSPPSPAAPPSPPSAAPAPTWEPAPAAPKPIEAPPPPPAMATKPPVPAPAPPAAEENWTPVAPPAWTPGPVVTPPPSAVTAAPSVPAPVAPTPPRLPARRPTVGRPADEGPTQRPPWLIPAVIAVVLLLLLGGGGAIILANRGGTSGGATASTHSPSPKPSTKGSPSPTGLQGPLAVPAYAPAAADPVAGVAICTAAAPCPNPPSNAESGTSCDLAGACKVEVEVRFASVQRGDVAFILKFFDRCTGTTTDLPGGHYTPPGYIRVFIDATVSLPAGARSAAIVAVTSTPAGAASAPLMLGGDTC